MQSSIRSDNFLLKIPLINESFLNVSMKNFSVLNPDDNLLIEKSNGQITENMCQIFNTTIFHIKAIRLAHFYVLKILSCVVKQHCFILYL